MKAADWCRSSAGAALVLATSSDEQHPAENVADGSSETFWTTTVRTLRIERSVSKDPVGFEQCIEKDLQHTEGQLQMEEFPLPDFQATYLRFIIKSAFDHFVSVHRVMAEGTAEDT
ncbi:intraflagellar transport protein 25 homolog isoform X2 [Buteo buteo]|uniref:intraflagellar transport protein 25 homolog isoform X2 n=1 Tax=Buteo buteo TaxID=30397 RepID=UPI003EB6C74D